MSILKWIWGLLKKVWFALDYFIKFMLDIFSSVAAWIIAGLAWLVHLLFQYVGGFFEGLFENLESINLGSQPVYPFAKWIAHDLLALDVAWEVTYIFFSVWVASRILRTSFAGVRAILDLV